MHSSLSVVLRSLRWAVAAIVCLGFVASCAPKEDIPAVRSSVGLSMDGSRSIPFSGAPDLITQTSPIDSTAAPGGWSTPPVPLHKPYGFAVGTRDGKIFIFNDRDSLAGAIDAGHGVILDQLLADENSLYAIGTKGELFAYSPDGKLRWQTALGEYVSANALLGANALILPLGKSIRAVSTSNGQVLWTSVHQLSPVSIALDQESSSIVVALSTNVVGGTDSVIVLSMEGARKQQIGLAETRITSNIALHGESQDERTIVFGYLGEQGAARRTARVCAIKGLLVGKPKLLWSHVVPYIIGNVAVNERDAFVSGFRMGETEVVSGIESYSLEDTTTKWSRRFSEPLSSPICASAGNVYFTLAFQSDAFVPTRGLFYTLSAGDGRTISERPVKGALHGFFPGMPMPDEQGRFLVADRARLIVHIIDRSTLKRVF